MALLPSACDPIKDQADWVPDNWNPSLNQTRQFVDDISHAPSLINQQFLSNTSQNLADISDARLFITYVRLMQQLNGKGRAVLFSEQRQWLKSREQKSRAAVLSKGGSLASLEYNYVFVKLTEARLAELSKQLNQAGQH